MRSLSAAAVAVVCIATASCNKSQTPGAAPAAFPPATVKLETAHTLPLEDTTEYVATLKSLRGTAIQPQIEGQVTDVFVTSGQRVARGDQLVRIDARRQEAAVASQHAERAEREADVAYAHQQQERASGLYAAGAISKQELEQSETAVRTAEARLQALQAQVQQQEVQLRYFTVTAPTAGVIGDVPVRVGNLVTPQTVLTTIDQNDVLELQVQVPVERASALKNGLPLRVLNSDSTQTIAQTTVNFISPHVDDQTQSVLVKGNVRNTDGTLRASQFVRAQIVWNTSEGLVVPVTALVRINGQYFAFIAEETKGADGKAALVARQRPVKIGRIVGDNYSIVDGMKAGDRVVVAGTQKLADGAPLAPAQ